MRPPSAIDSRKRCRISRFLLSAFLFLLLAPGTARSVEYFVRVDGDDLSDGLSHDSAWRTIAHAEDAADSNSVIHVLEGEYREDSHGAGYLYINSTNGNRLFLALGDVTLVAAGGSTRVLHFDTAASQSFSGFTIDGENLHPHGVTSYFGNKTLTDCEFRGCLERGIFLAGASGVTVEDCRFGTESAPLPATGIRLDHSPGCRIANCTFFPASGDAIQSFWSDSLTIVNNVFGSLDHPLHPDNSAAVYVYESQAPLIEANALFLKQTHGIMIPDGDGEEVVGPRVVQNSIRFLEVSESYGILIGSEGPVDYPVVGAEITGNMIESPIGESYRHDLFVGFSESPLIENNQLVGGGYGIVSKGNDGAEVLGNTIRGTWINSILDKAGHDSRIASNVCLPETGRCARVADDPGSGRSAAGSLWLDNVFSSTQFCIELSTPVEPAANGVSFDASEYCLEDEGQVVALIDGAPYTLPMLVDEFGWEVESSTLIGDPVVLAAPEDLAVDLPLEVDLDWLDAGTGDYELQLGVECGEGEIVQASASSWFWGGLLPQQQYYWRVRAANECGSLGAWSDCFRFTTEPLADSVPESSSDCGLPALNYGVFPNPALRNFRISFSLPERARVSLEIFSVSGRRERILLSGAAMEAGDFSRRWDGRDDRGALVPAGIYFGRLSTADLELTAKLVLFGK